LFCFGVSSLNLVLGLLGLVSLRVRFIFQVSSGVRFGYSYFKLVLALDLVSFNVRLLGFCCNLEFVLVLVSLLLVFVLVTSGVFLKLVYLLLVTS